MIIKSDFLNLAHQIKFIKKEFEDVTFASITISRIHPESGRLDSCYSFHLTDIINNEVKKVLGYCLISPPHTAIYQICDKNPSVEITGNLEVDMKAIKKNCKANIKRVKQLIKQCIKHNRYVVELENKCIETNLAIK